MAKDDGVRDNDSLCVGSDQGVTSVVVHSGANVVAFTAAEVPCSAGCSFGVGDDFASRRSHWRCIVIKWSIEVLVGGFGGIKFRSS